MTAIRSLLFASMLVSGCSALVSSSDYTGGNGADSGARDTGPRDTGAGDTGLSSPDGTPGPDACVQICDCDGDRVIDDASSCDTAAMGGPRDCDDHDPTVFPGALPVCNDGQRQACDVAEFDPLRVALGGPAEIGLVAPYPVYTRRSRSRAAAKISIAVSPNAAQLGWLLHFVAPDVATLTELGPSGPIMDQPLTRVLPGLPNDPSRARVRRVGASVYAGTIAGTAGALYDVTNAVPTRTLRQFTVDSSATRPIALGLLVSGAEEAALHYRQRRLGTLRPSFVSVRVPASDVIPDARIEFSAITVPYITTAGSLVLMRHSRRDRALGWNAADGSTFEVTPTAFTDDRPALLAFSSDRYLALFRLRSPSLQVVPLECTTGSCIQQPVVGHPDIGAMLAADATAGVSVGFVASAVGGMGASINLRLLRSDGTFVTQAGGADFVGPLITRAIVPTWTELFPREVQISVGSHDGDFLLLAAVLMAPSPLGDADLWVTGVRACANL